MKGTITHTGLVENVAPGIVTVRILQASACSTCSAAQLCKSSESKEKLIDVRTPNAMSYAKGDSITIEASTSQALKAIFFAYAMPLILIVVVMLTVQILMGSDFLSALSALATLVIYFCGLFLCRHKLENKFTFKIKNI